MNRPSEELLRSWLHLQEEEAFEILWGPGSADVRARGQLWVIEWDDAGEVKLNGQVRPMWTADFRRQVKRAGAPTVMKTGRPPVTKATKKP